MAQASPVDFKAAADRVAAAAFGRLTQTLRTGTEEVAGGLPILSRQEPFVMAALIETAFQTMQWVASMVDAGVDLSPLRIRGDILTFGKCVECSAPFYTAQAAIPWSTPAGIIELCVTCSAAKMKERKGKGK